jgi:hypothetical protein
MTIRAQTGPGATTPRRDDQAPTVIQLPAGPNPAPTINAGTAPVTIHGHDTGTTTTRGLVRAAGRPAVTVHNITATGPGFAAFQTVNDVTATRVDTTGVGWVIDYARTLTLRDVAITGVGTPAAPAAAINGRYRQWEHVDLERLTIADIAGDGLHFPGGITTDAGRRTAPPVTGSLRDVHIVRITDTTAHSDAIQLAGASEDFLLEDLVIHTAPSALQITPAQNHANRPGTGSGESTGLGAHHRLRLHRCTLTNAGPARIFNAPDLELDDVVQTGRGTVDIRRTQLAAPTDAQPWIVQHPPEDWTTIRVFRKCRIDRLLLDANLDIDPDPARVGGNKIGRIELPDGGAHPNETKLRALLERPLKEEEPVVPDPPADPVQPVPPTDDAPTYAELERRNADLEQDLRTEVILRVAAENRLSAVRAALDA